MTDVVERAKSVLGEFDAIGLPNIHNVKRYQELVITLCGLAPDLVAEIERLRSEAKPALDDGDWA